MKKQDNKLGALVILGRIVDDPVTKTTYSPVTQQSVMSQNTGVSQQELTSGLAVALAYQKKCGFEYDPTQLATIIFLATPGNGEAAVQEYIKVLLNRVALEKEAMKLRSKSKITKVCILTKAAVKEMGLMD